MNAKEIITLNNEKREQLNEKNLAYYEDMLIYIRLQYNKSEQQTEEVLLEILEHLLQAQEEGRTAEDIFGNDPKTYCRELIGEIPKENNSHQLLFITYIGLQFLAIISLVHGFIGFGLHYFFDLGTKTLQFSLGSGTVNVIIFLLLLWLFITLVLKWIKRSAFQEKKTKKWVEFLQLWSISTGTIGLFVSVPFFMPSFGTVITIPTLLIACVGIILYVISFVMNKKMRITK
ncbi:DUF1129 family protein [Virgibacillus ndiopensis]|uniref:DUF1129 family protein n=1 Tax=Virgibacillus ndiopensis TaxID=2004408 RepID=UPI001FEAD604|nr:DUF1129 family protein [Virgibacillus ndiopensis]